MSSKIGGVLVKREIMVMILRSQTVAAESDAGRSERRKSYKEVSPDLTEETGRPF